MAEDLKASLSALRQRCLTNMAACPVDPFLKKSAEACVYLINFGFPDCEDKTVVSSWLKKYAQAVLDETFYEENVLVQNEFPDSGGVDHMVEILDCLSSPEKCIRNIYPDEDIDPQILGEELIECIHWRKGALQYMYCSTIMEKPDRALEHHKHVVQYCKGGIDSLQFMLNVRKPLTETKQQVSTNDEAAVELLQKGIFSDTHMLALVYCGEMCTWCVKLCGQEDCAMDKKEKGIQYLTLYNKMIEGPLKDKGWSGDQAREFLEYLQNVS